MVVDTTDDKPEQIAELVVETYHQWLVS
jgi:hypothetical protein